MFYNGPYYKIPTVTLGQDIPEYYHTSGDDYSNICFDKIDEYEKLIFNIIDIIETDYIPVLKYKGPLCLSRHGLFMDIKVNPDAYIHTEAMQILADGSRSCFDIACACGAEYEFVKDFFDKIIEKNCVKSCSDLNVFC